MNFVQELIDAGHMPILTSFLLGILTAISPCPLATNIVAVGYLGKDIHSTKKIFFCGILYAIGRIITYWTISIVLIFLIRKGLDTYHIQKSIYRIGEVLISPFLIVSGILILLSNKITFAKTVISNKWLENINSKYCGSIFLGIILALTFCQVLRCFISVC